MDNIKHFTFKLAKIDQQFGHNRTFFIILSVFIFIFPPFQLQNITTNIFFLQVAANVKNHLLLKKYF
jgi:hypothetical protein